MANQNEQRNVTIKVNDAEALSSMNELKQRSRTLRKEWEKTTNANHRKKLATEIKSVNTEMGKLSATTKTSTSAIGKLSKSFSTMVGVVGGLAVLSVISDGMKSLIDRSAKLSDALADVMKTTGLTEREAKALSKTLGTINTRTGRSELLALARDAGKLGITGTANIRKFVEQADIINVALGEDLGSDAIKTIGKLSNVFKTEMVNIASALNTVGSKSEASEAQMVSFLKRLGGIAEVAQLSAPEIIGYGATLDSLGIKVERGATAMNNFFIEFTKDAEKFGEVAGFAEGELSKLVGEQGTNTGFVAFLEKLKEAHPESDKFLLALEELGITSTKGAETFLTLANNTERLKEQQVIANDAFIEGTSVIDEFNVKNTNLAASITKVMKALNQKLMSSSLMEGIERFFESAGEYIKVPLSNKLEEEQTQLNMLVARINDSNISNESRLGLIKQLHEEYPDFLGDLDAETVSNEQLVKRLKDVNKQLVNKIIIKRKEEELAAQGSRTADAQEARDLKKEQLERLLTDAYKQNGLQLEANMTIEERMSALREKIGEKATKTGSGKNARQSKEHKLLEKIGFAYTHMTQTEAAYQARIEEGNEILAEREALEKQFGLNVIDEPPSSLVPPPLPPLTPPPPLDAAALAAQKAAQKAKEDFAKNTKALIKELRDSELTAIQEVERAEIAALRLKFQRDKERIEKTEATEDSKADLVLAKHQELERQILEVQAKSVQAQKEQAKQKVDEINKSDLLTLQLAVDIEEEGSEAQILALQNLLGKQFEIELQNLELTEEQKLLIYEKFLKERKALEEKQQTESAEFSAMTFQEQMEVVSNHIQKFGAIAQDAMGMAFDFANANQQAQLDKFIADQDSQKRILQDNLDSGLISRGAYDKKMEQMEAARVKKEKTVKRKEFANKKASDTISAIINTAVGVTAGLGAPWPLGIVFAALAGVMGAAEVAMIQSQPNPFYRGGYTDVTDTEGNTHHAKDIGSFASNAGYHSTPSYGVVGEKGTELVVPNWMLKSNEYSDAIGQIEQGIYRSNESTNTNSNKNANAGSQNISTTESNSKQNAQSGIIEALNRNSAIMSQLQKDGVQGVWEHDRFENGIRQVEENTGRHILSSNNNRIVGEAIT